MLARPTIPRTSVVVGADALSSKSLEAARLRASPPGFSSTKLTSRTQNDEHGAPHLHPLPSSHPPVSPPRRFHNERRDVPPPRSPWIPLPVLLRLLNFPHQIRHRVRSPLAACLDDPTNVTLFIELFHTVRKVIEEMVPFRGERAADLVQMCEAYGRKAEWEEQVKKLDPEKQQLAALMDEQKVALTGIVLRQLRMEFGARAMDAGIDAMRRAYEAERS